MAELEWCLLWMTPVDALQLRIPSQPKLRAAPCLRDSKFYPEFHLVGLHVQIYSLPSLPKEARFPLPTFRRGQHIGRLSLVAEGELLWEQIRLLEAVMHLAEALVEAEL